MDKINPTEIESLSVVYYLVLNYEESENTTVGGGEKTEIN